MSRSRKRPPAVRGPNIGELSMKIGYEDSRILSKILLEFRHFRYPSSEDFSTCLDDQLIDLTNELLAAHGDELWPQTNIPPKPKYPADLKLIHKNVYEIYRRQRRNQCDVLAKRRKNEVNNRDEDVESELLDNSEVLSNHRDEYEQYTFYPLSSHEPSTASPSQPTTQNQQPFQAKPNSLPIDPEILNGLGAHAADPHVSRKRTYSEMQNGAPEDHILRSDGTNQDQQHSAESPPKPERIVRLRMPQIDQPWYSARNSARPAKETIDLTVTTESDGNMSIERPDQIPSMNRASGAFEAASESTCKPGSAANQARLQRVVEYVSALSQTTPISACSSGTQTLGANTNSQSTQTLHIQQKSAATQTMPVESETKTYNYDDGCSAPIQGGCDSAFALLTTIMDVIVDERLAATRKVREAKTDAEKKLRQETANAFSKVYERIQQEITLLGFTRVKSE